MFRCNPEKYRLDDRLKDSNRLTTWRVNKHCNEICTGDTAFIWAGIKGGIRAILRIDSEPREMPEMEHELPYYVHNQDSGTCLLDSGVRLRVVATYIDMDVHLSAAKINEVSVLKCLEVFKGYHQQTNYAVTPSQGETLLGLIGVKIE